MVPRLGFARSEIALVHSRLVVVPDGDALLALVALFLQVLLVVIVAKDTLFFLAARMRISNMEKSASLSIGPPAGQSIVLWYTW